MNGRLILVGLLALNIPLTAQMGSQPQQEAWERAENDYRNTVHHYGVNSPEAVRARRELDEISKDLEEHRPNVSNKPDPRKSNPTAESAVVHPEPGPAPDNKPNGSM